MHIIIYREDKPNCLDEESFKDEAELQACLEQNPRLLISEYESAVITVQREVQLPSAGNLDLLVVDKEGLSIAVEIKLARNTQCRRDVVAQAFDYVSDLSNKTFEELDDIVFGALSDKLQALVGIVQSLTVRTSRR